MTCPTLEVPENIAPKVAAHATNAAEEAAEQTHLDGKTAARAARLQADEEHKNQQVKRIYKAHQITCGQN